MLLNQQCLKKEVLILILMTPVLMWETNQGKKMVSVVCNLIFLICRCMMLRILLLGYYAYKIGNPLFKNYTYKETLVILQLIGIIVIKS